MKTKINSKKTLSLILTALLAPASSVLAQQQTTVENPSEGYLLNLDDLGLVLLRAIEWMTYLAGSLAVLFLIVGGIQYVISSGNEEAATKAKKTMTGAIIGIVVVIMAVAIVTIIEDLIIN